MKTEKEKEKEKNPSENIKLHKTTIILFMMIVLFLGLTALMIVKPSKILDKIEETNNTPANKTQISDLDILKELQPPSPNDMACKRRESKNYKNFKLELIRTDIQTPEKNSNSNLTSLENERKILDENFPKILGTKEKINKDKNIKNRVN